MNKNGLFDIFKIFFLIGAQLLGGGYVIVPLLKKYVIDEKKWMNEEELTDFYAMAQCLPGIIAGNIAVLCGYRIKGIPGAIAAISGTVLPAFISIIVIANILSEILNNNQIQNAFWGIRIAVTVLILITVKELWKKSVNSFFTYILFFCVFFSFLFLPVSPAAIIILSGIISCIYARMRNNA